MLQKLPSGSGSSGSGSGQHDVNCHTINSLYLPNVDACFANNDQILLIVNLYCFITTLGFTSSFDYNLSTTSRLGSRLEHQQVISLTEASCFTTFRFYRRCLGTFFSLSYIDCSYFSVTQIADFSKQMH